MGRFLRTRIRVCVEEGREVFVAAVPQRATAVGKWRDGDGALKCAATKSNSVVVGLQECEDDAAELFGLLDVHEVAGIFDYHAARVGDAVFNDSRVSVDVRNVLIA